MEAIEHRQSGRRKRNSAKVNLTLSIALHVVLFGLGAFWAAREGMMGKGLQSLTVVLVPKEKKPEEDKKEEPKPAEAKPVTTPTRTETARAADLPRPSVPPPPAFVDTSAPPPAEPPVLTLGDTGGPTGDASAVGAYKSYLETTLRNGWNRPETVSDLNFVAEVEVMVNANGQIQRHELKQSSGDRAWDDSVIKAVNASRSLGRTPPPGFPERFVVRFDVVAPENLPLL